MPDVGFTHIALAVSDLDLSIAFYQRYASMSVVHRRPMSEDEGNEIAWIGDRTRPFVIVLAEVEPEAPLGPFGHLGVACPSVEEVDRLMELAKEEGCYRDGPHGNVGEPAGYYVNLSDPDGHTLELSFGQEVGLTVNEA